LTIPIRAAVSILKRQSNEPQRNEDRKVTLRDARDSSRTSLTQTATYARQVSGVSFRGVESIFAKAKTFLRNTAIFGDIDARVHALKALGEWGDTEAFDFLHAELRDTTVPSSARRAAAVALTHIDSKSAIQPLVNLLGESDHHLVESAADLLGQIGAPALEPVLSVLNDSTCEEGALLALQHLPPPPAMPMEDFARAAVSRSVKYDRLTRNIKATGKNDALSLLRESLHDKSHRHGIRALQAIGLLGDREAMNLAIENLETRDATNRANVIEALDSISTKWRDIIRPLMHLWEDESVMTTDVDWQRLLTDDDPWIRECAEYAAHQNGELNMDTISTLSMMDRILFFKRVPLFENLSPADLKQVAAIAEEEVFPDGETIAEQGEQGDAMFIIVSGEVRVCRMKDGKETELARRKSGDYVGEMSIVNREPRIASLIAKGDVRALCIDQKSFEGLLQERPDVSLAIIKVLSNRLKELGQKLESIQQTNATSDK
jgi:CRP/FNR family transcriptional regulator, cyclic AMP receptor protein